MAATAPPPTSPLSTLKMRLGDMNALHAAIGIMDWDMQTYMPPGGSEARAQHVSRLMRMHHDLFTSDEVQRLVEESSRGATGDDAAMLRVVKRELDQATKIPAALVEEKAKLTSTAFDIWVKARAANDFKSFAPYLERVVEIVREEAEYLGYKDHIYDALIDLYEEGATTADCRQMFDGIRQPLTDLVRAIAAKPQVDDSVLHGAWSEPAQKAFTEMIVKAVGFDFQRGRQDKAAHPFCTGWSIGDIRLTTRYKDNLLSAIFSSLHEAGHGMYEQFSPKEWDLTPLCGGVSLGLHESQSRTWENLVGRSRAFWVRFLPDLKQAFPQLAALDVDSFYRMANKVQPSLIRVEADEVTYNLHVLIRFELECDMLTGALTVRDLPEAWSSKYQTYLGVRPATDSEGCLQDVHWSGGSIGYFPTYSMGTVLSFQIWASMARDLGDLDAVIQRGDLASIHGWLVEKIYSQGRRYTPKELVQRVTGKPFETHDYLKGLTAKYAALYGL
ncbi:MAG: carboxypeptidase M32 [Fimbriimonas ginsengisoli]|uniref:Metal-dependent carboxypeptidase n=1 Tax=Fimbriimonas ginsengisoli TaxID=1005039 RepID=A0A931M035_FIMGI|nr:carboxypeptidase M32 [Fimbriimonas ginsengisoli]